MTTEQVIDEIRQMHAGDIEEVLSAIASICRDAAVACEGTNAPANVQAFEQADKHCQLAVLALGTRSGD